MEAFHDVLATRSDEVMHRWRAMVEGTLAPAGTSAVELIDHLPLFVREVIGALRADAGLTAPVSGQAAQTAADHGEQRLRLGFSLDAVVREYGALRDAMIATARDAGVEISFRELDVISRSTISGIAHAVVEYTRQRDTELKQQHNEHVAFIAHELRTPLSAAISALYLLKTKQQIPTEARETGALQRGLTQMRELIDHSLNVARAASGIDLRKERVRLSALLEEAQLIAAPEAEQKKIALGIRLEADAEVYLDVRLVRSALSNLVRNGVKYSRDGGSVEIRAKVAAERVTIEVEDCCGGLEPGQVEAAFAPFVRFHESETGFGLGLAIAKQAVDAHGGSIRVQNLPGKGCIFILELPAAMTLDAGASAPNV